MTSPAVEISTFLQTGGIGTLGASSDWGIFTGREPTDPDTAVTVYDTPSAPSNPKFLLDEPSIQTRIRGAINGYLGGYDKAQEIKDLLLGIPKQVIGQATYVGIWQTSDIMFLKFDDNDRPLFTINWRMFREPFTPSGTNRESL